MAAFFAWGNVPRSFVVAKGSVLDYQSLPPDYEGMFRSYEWNAMKLSAFCTGPGGYHWAMKVDGGWSARGPKDMMEVLPTQLVTRGSNRLASPGRGRATYVAFAPDGISWFVRYSTKICFWGPELHTFPPTWQSLVRELERNHPRKDECIEFVAFGLHELLLVRYENGNSQMLLPENPAIRSQISTELIQEVEGRLQAGWTLGNRTMLCAFDTHRWFIEWRRGSSAEFRYSMGIEESEKEDLERITRVLSGVGNDAGLVANQQTAQLIAANARLARVRAVGRAINGTY